MSRSGATLSSLSRHHALYSRASAAAHSSPRDRGGALFSSAGADMSCVTDIWNDMTGDALARPASSAFVRCHASALVGDALHLVKEPRRKDSGQTFFFSWRPPALRGMPVTARLGLALAMGAMGAAAFAPPAAVVRPRGPARPRVSPRPSRAGVCGAEPRAGLSGRPLGSALLPDLHRGRCAPRQWAPSMAASSEAGGTSLASLVKQGAQVGVGAVAIFAVERALWAASKATGVWIPTAPAGMLLVFALLLVIHAVSPKAAGAIKDWFTPVCPLCTAPSCSPALPTALD